MQTPYDHFAYMRHLAQQIPQIRQYVASTDWTQLTQLLAQLNSMRTPCLVADYDYAARVVDHQADNPMLYTRYGVMILDIVPPAHAERAHQALRETRGIADLLIAHLLRHQAQGLHGLTHLQVPSIRLETLPPVADHALGVGVTYAVLSPLPRPKI